MGIGPQLTNMKTALIVQLILGPIGFGLLSVFYHKKFGYTRPIVTATIFLLFVVGMDFFGWISNSGESGEVYECNWNLASFCPNFSIFIWGWGTGGKGQTKSMKHSTAIIFINLITIRPRTAPLL
jgi:hypothetical protein